MHRHKENATDTFSLSQIDGFMVGHAENEEGNTGCTAILVPDGASASFHTPGFAPGSRETELLRPESSPQAIHGLLLTGGSAFGLAAATGVVRRLKELGAGYRTPSVRIPLVPAAVINDYPWNRSDGTLPDEAMGYEAAASASGQPLRSGPFGAGKAAASGKIAGKAQSSPSGFGTAGIEENGVQLAAVAVVNCMGSVVDPETGVIVSGARRPDGALACRSEILAMVRDWNAKRDAANASHTVLAAIGTNAPLGKLDAYRLSRMAAAGIARSVYPAHLLPDGDTVFALSSNTGPAADLNWLGALAADLLTHAILSAAKSARPIAAYKKS